VGYTKDIEQRLKTHNKGGSVYTKKYRPWELILSINFSDGQKAKSFEKYLKTASGKAFLRKHFV
jgi:predicted GIY-YIG superfamily endonuclease